jgi:hypothetical protein
MRRLLGVGLVALASLTAAGSAQAEDEICGLVVFYRQEGSTVVYRAVRYGAIDVVTTEGGVVFVNRVFVGPNDLVPLNPNQEFACVQ